MADERHIAEGSRLIVVADVQREKEGGLSGMIHAVGLDSAQNQAIALLGVIVISWLLMRLARWGLDRHSIAKAPPAPARIGHLVAGSVAKPPRAGKDEVRIKASRYAEPGRSFRPADTRRCAWKQLRPPAEGQDAQWFCTRCNATCEIPDMAAPHLCLRDG